MLVKYDGSRRPSSWKTKVITRNKAEATAMIESYRAQLEGEGDLKSAFAKLAGTESDCSSARDGGDLGTLQAVPRRYRNFLIGMAVVQDGLGKDPCRSLSKTRRTLLLLDLCRLSFGATLEPMSFSALVNEGASERRVVASGQEICIIEFVKLV